MNGVWEWLLGLDDIRLGRDAPLTLKWGVVLPAWALVGIGLVLFFAIAMVYRKERTSAPKRVVLSGLRAVLLGLVVALYCQPMLVLQQNRVERSHIALLLDTSTSMATRDHYSAGESAEAIARGAGINGVTELSQYTRMELIQRALSRDEAAPLRALLSRNALHYCTFAGSAETHAYVENKSDADQVAREIMLLVPDGGRTNLAGALRKVIQRTEGRRLAAVILATDGQATDGAGLSELLDVAGDRNIPIYALKIGSPVRPVDVEVGPLRAEERVFVDDIVAIEVPVSVRGLVVPTEVTVSLTDEATGSKLAEEVITLDPSEPTTTVELRTKVTRTGLVRFVVAVDPVEGERVVENNTQYADVTVVDNRVKILYVDAYPRYEYRYIKNALTREETVELGVLLLEADAEFVQEGTDPIRRFPQTPQELNQYDVVLFGDVDPRGGWLSPAQMNLLLDFVGHEGGGFGLIAGERSAPQHFAGTPLEKLIPVRIDRDLGRASQTTLAKGFQPSLTLEGRHSRIFRFAADREVSDSIFESLPELFWFAKTLGPKPGATVLVEHPSVHSYSGSMPIMALGRYGAGKTFFQGTDDTWRWREHSGEFLHDTYWARVGRELMRETRLGRDRRFVLRLDRRTYPYGQPVQAQLEVFDTALLADLGDTVELSVSSANELSLGADQLDAALTGRFEAHRVSDGMNTFEGTFIPPRPGAYFITVSGIAPMDNEQVKPTYFRVRHPDLEARRPEADHQTLERIALATGGEVIELDEIAAKLGAIADRNVEIPDDVVEPLWDSRLMLLLIVLTLTTEWTLRKVFGLL